jgi:hypothetical protein
VLTEQEINSIQRDGVLRVYIDLFVEVDGGKKYKG